MKRKILKWLFKDDEELDELKNYVVFLEDKLCEEEEKLQKMSMADLMRDSIGLPYIDFVNVGKDGYPPHYLDGMSKEERLVFQAELATIFKNGKFHKMLDYWISMFGNHSIRKGKDEVDAGRYSINGVAMIRKSLEAAHSEVVEDQKPPDKFDPLEPLPEN